MAEEDQSKGSLEGKADDSDTTVMPSKTTQESSGVTTDSIFLESKTVADSDAEAKDSSLLSSKTTPEVAADAPDGMLLASGEVTYLGKGHQLCLTHKGLRLVALAQDGGAGDVGSSVDPVLDVPWREVMCACLPAVKKSKSSVKEVKPEAGEAAASMMFMVHYMQRNRKTNKQQRKSVKLDSRQETAEDWIMKIEEKRKEGKPQKLLIIINPVGGKGNARQVFEKCVQPIFALAGVELVVKVAERYQHALEMAKTFDVSSVDGVVVMGGDGMYMEILHGLTLRKQEEEGVDINDPEVNLVPPTVRVGIIPTGTGNGMSQMMNGVVDVETATLNIIRGETDRANIFAIHEGNKLIKYAGLLLANGFFSSIIKRSEELRWMRRMRYAYVMLGSILGKKRIHEYAVQVLRVEEQCEDSKEQDATTGGATATTQSGWTDVGVKRIMAIMAMVCQMREGVGELLYMNPFTDGFDLMFLDSASTMDTFKFFYGLMTRKNSAFSRPFISLERNIRGARFQLVQQAAEGATSSSDQTQLVELGKILDVDGEVVSLSEPKFEVRLHSRFLQVFCLTDYLDELRPPS